MATYIIQRRIDTLLELWEPFELDGFSFRASGVDLIEGTQNGWVAKKEVEAETAKEAFNTSSKNFRRLVDRIAFIGQCQTTADLEDFLITKPNDSRFFWRCSKKRAPVPLQFNGEEVNSLRKSYDHEHNGDVFRYLTEAVNATSFYTMLVMLTSALESIAGSVTNERGFRRVDKNYIAENILKDSNLCSRIFGHGAGIRNQILHGGFVDEKMHGGTDYNSIIYKAIINFFNEKHGFEISTEAVGTPRTVTGNYGIWMHWCEWLKTDEDISLELLHEKFEVDDSNLYFRSIEEPADF